MAAGDMKKMTKGRQKIQMKLIEDKEDRVITFSKRKAGIFKKASEISVMCGAKALLILFSPVGKAYSFGHPSVKSVADKFLAREESEGARRIRQILETHLNNRLEKLVLHHFVARSELEAASEQVIAVSGDVKFGTKGCWEANVSAMSSVEEVQQVMRSVSDFQVALSNHFENLRIQNVGQGCNNNNQLGDVNNFPQMNNNVRMTDWTGDSNLSNVGAFEGFDNFVGGVNDAGLYAVGNGGALGQGSDNFSLPAAGNYGGVLGRGNGFSLPAAGNYGGNFGHGNEKSNLPAAGNYGGELGLDNGFSLPAAGNYGGNFGQGDGNFNLTAAGYGGTIGQSNDPFSLPAAGYGTTLGQGNDHFSVPAAGYEGTLGYGNGFSMPATGYRGTAGLSEGGSFGGAYNVGNFGADAGAGSYGPGYGGSFMDGIPDPANAFQAPY